jgi:gliding motility-associated-like protein
MINVSEDSAQNLVLNPSFEDYTSCPNMRNQLSLCNYCHNPNLESPDYYNICSAAVVSVPNNWAGYQSARTGNAYVGFYALSLSNSREYVTVSLSNTLIHDSCYMITFYISKSNFSNCAIANLQVYFSNDIIFYNTLFNIQIQPSSTFYSSKFFSDTLSWIKLESKYVANGDEKYLTIGNFYDDNSTERKVVFGDSLPTTIFQSYYYLDDVSVEKISCHVPPIDTDTIVISPALQLPTAFTPNHDGKNDLFRVLNKSYAVNNFVMKIFNRYGEEVFESNDINTGWDGTFKNKDCEIGSYVYVLTYEAIETKETKIQKGGVILIR